MSAVCRKSDLRHREYGLRRKLNGFVNLDEIRKHLSISNIQDNAYALNEIERSCCYEDFERSSIYCEKALKAAGFSNVERIRHNADGVSCAFDCVMPEAWDFDKKKRSFLEIVDDTLPESQRIIADSTRNPLHVAVWSAPTPPKGITAELVDFDTLKPGHYEEVRGKWLLFASRARYTSLSPAPLLWGLYRELCNAGIAGIIFCDLNCADILPNDLCWQNGIGYTGWYLTKGEKHLPFYSITPLVGRRLLKLMQKGPVTLHGELYCRNYDGSIHTVTGIIPGESKEEIVLMAHLYEPFVNDDAAGFSFLCELGRQMMERGIKPKRTLRVVFSMELYGMAAYMSKHSENVVLAANFDGIPFKESVGKTKIRLTPFCCAHFTDWLNCDVLRALLPDDEVIFTENASYSDDTFTNDPYFGKGGIPTFWFHGVGGRGHHSTGYLFDPDWEDAARKLPVFAALIEFLLCTEKLPNYSNRAISDLNKNVDRIIFERRLSEFDKKIWLEAEYLRQTLRLKSVNAFTGQAVDFQALDKSWERICKRLSKMTECRKMSTAEEEALHLVPKRGKLGFPFSLGAVPLEDRSPVFLSHNTWAFFDGKRTLLECIRMADAERGVPSTSSKIAQDIAELKRLEKYGYLTLESI